MNKQYIQAKLQKAGDKIQFIATDETLDRSGEVIPIDSWDLSNFLKNPVLLVDHDYRVEKIVGKATNMVKDVVAKQLRFEPLFHGLTELSTAVNDMVGAEVLNTVSVGFLPHGPEKDGDRTRNELLEISFVAVPANPSAQRLKGLENLVNEEQKVEVKKWIHEVDTLNEEEMRKAVEKEAEEKGKQLAFEIDQKAFKDLTITNELLRLELAELKEGRVLSGRNRKRIEEAVSILKQASEAMEELLNATDPNAEKDAGKSREPKVVSPPSKSAPKADSAVRRALQRINKESNLILKELK